MSFPANRWTNIIILCILIAGVWIRATVYGDLHLSVGMPDTPTYVTSSVAPLTSSLMFSGKRLFTTNLLYKLIPGQQCVNIPISAPATGKEFLRKIQPCFNEIILLQNILSIMGWSLLAWIIAQRLAHPLSKIFAATFILAFSFTPQIAEWDSVLSSESISLSLFAVMLALLVEIDFRILDKEDQTHPMRTSLLLIGWLVVFALWLFVRDVNLSAALGTLILSAPLLFIKRLRENKIFSAILILLAGLFLLGLITSRQSSRQQIPLTNSFNQYIFFHPARVEYFKAQGMPADRTGNEYKTWFNDRAANVYLKFLVTHPGFVSATLLENISYFQTDFSQPYYKIPEFASRNTFIRIGDIFHPQTNAVYVIDALLLIALYAVAYNNGKVAGWAWLGTWLFFYSSVYLFLGFFGDADGVTRHIFPAVESFRLFLWIFLIAHMDISIVCAQGLSEN